MQYIFTKMIDMWSRNQLNEKQKKDVIDYILTNSYHSPYYALMLCKTIKDLDESIKNLIFKNILMLPNTAHDYLCHFHSQGEERAALIDKINESLLYVSYFIHREASYKEVLEVIHNLKGLKFYTDPFNKKNYSRLCNEIYDLIKFSNKYPYEIKAQFKNAIINNREIAFYFIKHYDIFDYNDKKYIYEKHNQFIFQQCHRNYNEYVQHYCQLFSGLLSDKEKELWVKKVITKKDFIAMQAQIQYNNIYLHLEHLDKFEGILLMDKLVK